MSRWGVFIGALIATVSVAMAFGIGLSHAFAAPVPVPALRTVPNGALTAAGITLSTPRQPPFCQVEQGAPALGWRGPGWTRCAMTRQQAEAARLPAVQGTVSEALLARASGPVVNGSGRLVWLVVVRSTLPTLPIECDPPRGGMVCGWAHPVQTSSTLVVVLDAVNGSMITTIPVQTGT